MCKLEWCSILLWLGSLAARWVLLIAVVASARAEEVARDKMRTLEASPLGFGNVVTGTGESEMQLVDVSLVHICKPADLLQFGKGSSET